MKLLQNTALLTLVSLGAIATAFKPVSAQNVYDPWTGATVDTTECNYYYDQCWLGSDGEVYGSNSGTGPDSATFTWDNSGTDYYPLNEDNNYFDPSNSDLTSTPSSSSGSSHQDFIDYIWQ